MMTDERRLIHILWINAGLSCDGDSVALTAATQPSIEEIALGTFPGLPRVAVHWPLIDFESGPERGVDNFIEWFHKADRGELDPFILVVEGSVPDERLSGEGYFTGFGRDSETDQPITVNEWLDRLTPKATIVLAVGTCATYGGIHAMAGNPTGAMGVPDYLGWDWTSKSGIPIVCLPGCPAHPDNLSETILYLLYQIAGQAPMIPLDDQLRPQWLFSATVHEGCDRAGYYEQGEFAETYDSRQCLVKLGCAGQAVTCNVPKRGWINGVGGCPNVGGICIGCTMPGFPDKFMPFMDAPTELPATSSASNAYGTVIRSLRHFTFKKVNTPTPERNTEEDAADSPEAQLPEELRRELDRLRGEHAEAREQSLRDSLTASYNRRYLDQRLDDMLAAERTGIAVALVDLDFFKQVNDKHGHHIGDLVLQRVVRILQEDLPDRAFCARYGGEEFVLVMPEISASAAVGACEAARARVEHHSWPQVAPGLQVTVSVGVAHRDLTGSRVGAEPPGRISGVSTLLRLADHLLYQAKQSGRNAVAYRCGDRMVLAGGAGHRRGQPSGPAHSASGSARTCCPPPAEP